MISFFIKNKVYIVLVILASLLMIIFIMGVKLKNQESRNEMLEQNYKALFKSDSLKNQELYVINAERNKLAIERPELEHQIDSLEHIGKVKVEKVEVETLKYKTDTVLLHIKDDINIDTIFKDNCIWTYLAIQDSSLSLVTEISGKMYIHHTTEKELVNPSKSKFANFFKKIFGKTREYDKVRIVDECGLLEDMEVINIYDK